MGWALASLVLPSHSVRPSGNAGGSFPCVAMLPRLGSTLGLFCFPLPVWPKARHAPSPLASRQNLDVEWSTCGGQGQGGSLQAQSQGQHLLGRVRGGTSQSPGLCFGCASGCGDRKKSTLPMLCTQVQGSKAAWRSGGQVWWLRVLRRGGGPRIWGPGALVGPGISTVTQPWCCC